MRSFVLCTVIGLVFAGASVAAVKPSTQHIAATGIVEAVLARDWVAARKATAGLADANGRDRSHWIVRQLEYLEVRFQGDTDLDVRSTATALELGIPLHNLMIATRELGAEGWKKLAPLAERAYAAGLADEAQDLTVASCHAGLLTELGRADEADRAFAPPASPDALDPIDVINVAYYHAARRDRARTLEWLRHAMAADPAETRTWAAQSDDLNAYRGDAEFRFVFGE
jgi:hypothetical protein